MSDSPLKSYQFRRQREPIWRELNILVDKVEGRGLSSLTTYEIIRLPALYRSVVSSLSVARKISLDRSLLNYLEALAVRAYFCVYATRTQFRRSVAIFFRTSFPQSVRRAGWHILAAGLIVLLGGLTSYVLTLANTDWYYTFIPAGLIGNRLPTTSTAELQATLYQGADVASAVAGFSSWLFSHNAGIGMLAFALGFALGIPSILLLFYNGLTIGAFIALFESRGLGGEVIGWLLIHGTTEILAVTLCGGAGLVVGTSVALPGRYTRLQNLAIGGRLASRIVVGSVVLFFVAALLEGFARQIIVSDSLRYLIGLTALLMWLLYFTRSGAGNDSDGG